MSTGTLSMNLNIVAGLVCTGVMLWLFQERNASRIRQSRYWFVGWAAYMLSLVGAARFLGPLFANVPDETMMPVFFVIVALIIVGCGAYLFWWQPRQMRKAARGS